MNVVLGFGQTETQYEAVEEAAFREYAEAVLADAEHGYFDDDDVKRIRAWLDARSKASKAESKKHDESSDPPERYSSFYVSLAVAASDLVAIYRFSHISRKHPMSPDGWGMMSTTRLFHVSKY